MCLAYDLPHLIANWKKWKDKKGILLIKLIVQFLI